MVCLLDDHKMIRQETPPVAVEKILPETVAALPDGYLLDFGFELTGSFCAEVCGERGACFAVLFGEEKAGEFAVRSDLRCNCNYRQVFTLDGGRNSFAEYDYKTFRYIQIITTDRLDFSEMYVLYRHYPFIEKPVQLQDKKLEQIWRICARAVKNCAQEAYLDCPHREKGQYLGDLTVTAHAHICLTGDTSLAKLLYCIKIRKSEL